MIKNGGNIILYKNDVFKNDNKNIQENTKNIIKLI
jgi:hypothetical protein